MEPVATLGVPHRSTQDTQYFGYDIPANTLLVTNIWGMHRDKKLWGDPENFRPERFLDYKGNLKKKDYTLPFGIGRCYFQCRYSTVFGYFFFSLTFQLFQESGFVQVKHSLDKTCSLRWLRYFRISIFRQFPLLISII